MDAHINCAKVPEAAVKNDGVLEPFHQLNAGHSTNVIATDYSERVITIQKEKP